MTHTGSARIVFDLDGTLVDSAPDIRHIANLLLEREGRAPLSAAETRRFIGHGAAIFIERLCAARDFAAAQQPRLLGDFVSLYDSAHQRSFPYPGVRQAILRFHSEGHRLGICTNKPLRPARSLLAHLDLERFFQAIVGGDSLSVRKPAPAPLNAVFNALGQGPAIYVGDSEVDAETADRAGVPFLLFTEGYRKGPVEAMPHHAAFDDFAELPDLVGALLRGRTEA